MRKSAGSSVKLMAKKIHLKITDVTKNESKNNLPWTFTFINASREELYYSYVLNSKQIFHWIPLCLLRSELISSFLHGNTTQISFLYTTVYFHKYHESYISNILKCKIWLKRANVIRKHEGRGVSHTLMKSGQKTLGTVSSSNYAFWVLALHHDIFKSIQPKSE